jgi:hypothetical protein
MRFIATYTHKYEFIRTTSDMSNPLPPQTWNTFVFLDPFHIYVWISRAVIVTSQQLETFEIIYKSTTDDMLLFSSTVDKSRSIFRSCSEQITSLRLYSSKNEQRTFFRSS